MIGDENPLPAPVADHTSFGPPSGHAWSNPRSGLTPSRRGPRNCGHPGSGDAISVALEAESVGGRAAFASPATPSSAAKINLPPNLAPQVERV